MKSNNIETMDCGCELTGCNTASKRYQTKMLIKKLKETNEDIDKSIFRAAENVNLDSIYRYVKGGEVHTFYDDWE